jgi:nucleoside-triphosphatase THEP1
MNIPPIIILSGPKFSGKSRFIERFITRIRNNGLVVGGFFQRGVFNESGEKVGYDLVGATDGSRTPIARADGGTGRWKFIDGAFKRAAGMLPENMQLCVMDEIGPLELSGKGHRAALEKVIEKSCALLIVVREELADEVRGILGAGRKIVEIGYSPGEEHVISERLVRIIKDHGG